MAILHDSPKNEIHWCKADYKKIELQKLVSWLDAFCNEHGNANQENHVLYGQIFSLKKTALLP